MEIFAALGGTVWTVFFFIVALSIIIFVHEYGHYIVGRWTGIHAEVFSLGFGPVIWSRMDRRGTRWQLAAVPFGGFVKFLGDADAASVRPGDTSGLSAAERRHTMAGAPLWARSATVAAGPVFNFVLTFFVLAGLLLYSGMPQEQPTVGKLMATPFAGPTLQAGDVIVAVDGTPTPDLAAFRDATRALPPEPVVDYAIQRGSDQISVKGPHPYPALVSMVLIRSAAMDAGIKEGDVILKAAGQDVTVFAQLPEIVAASKGAPVPLTIWRDGKTFEVTLTPRIRVTEDADGALIEKYQIGLGSGLVFEPATRNVGPLELVTLTGTEMWRQVSATFTGISHLITGQISTCNLSGPIGMAETMGDAARNGLESFLGMLAVLSLGVGILNLFPIPVLDGGHLVFHAYEAVVRRPPSDRALRVMMSLGLAVILSLMVFALTNDIVCV
ncbi:RIP metalloprotease RseP [Tabrizicola sp.]|uniref:RIP metalloprotease RseP n=1 Tax=Tabrizicola sp. TaxID=2005166 RepID=UPI00286C2CAB|nr:RIP metalloprotease RseP [Tabrizicola sp.]